MTLNNYLHALHAWQKIIFSIYLQRDYLEQHYVYEKTLAEQQHRLLTLLDNSSVDENWQACHELMMSLSALRYREEDMATWEICYQEFLQISESFALVFAECNERSITTLRESISSLEQLYESTLSNVAKHPLIYAIFIEDLFALADILEQSRPHKQVPSPAH